MGILKLPGLASGLDTDGLIKALMTLERKPVVSLQARRDKLATEANAWRDLNQRLLTLQKRLEDVKNFSAAGWDGKKAAVTDTSVLTAAVESTAATGTYTVEVLSLAKATILQSAVMDPASPVADPNQDLNLSGTVQVAGTTKTFTVAATDSLNDIAATINAQKDTLGFSAAVVQVSTGDYRLVLTGKTGAVNDFALEDAAGSTVAASLKLTQASGATKAEVASNGQLKVNGITITTEGSTVKDAIAGTTMTVAKTGTVTVTVSEDNSKAAAAVKAFVDQYNSVLDLVAMQTSYDPETKAAGPLLGNDRVASIQQNLRSLLVNPVSAIDDKFESLAMVGITAEKFVSGQKSNGKLVFDQAKFEKALDENPNAVRDLFQLSTVDGDGKPVKGVAVRSIEWLENYTKTDGILSGQETVLTKEVDRIKDRIKVWEEQILPKREERLRAQYVALEKAMNTMQNQSNWLSSQLKSLMSSKDQ